MDTSKEYIKMCDCPEIQDGWKPCKADFIWYKDEESLSFYLTQDYTLSNILWLPRQDQLQEMLPDFLDEKTTYLCELTRAITDDFYKMERIKTWEQFWLAFVMKEKHNKIWDNGWLVLNVKEN